MIKYLKQGWLVLAIAGAFGAALAGVQLSLKDRIAANQLNKTYSKIPQLMLREGHKLVDGSIKISYDKETEVATITAVVKDQENKSQEVSYQALKAEVKDDKPYPVYRVLKNGQEVGWVVQGEGNGFADKIVALVAVSPGGSDGCGFTTLKGVSVIKQMETPNLGDKITGNWVDQYAGKSATKALVVKKGGAESNSEIDAISGATISSNALTGIVNKTKETFWKDMGAGKISIPTPPIKEGN